MQLDQISIGNQLISDLSPADFALLAPHMVRINLPRAFELSAPGTDMIYCWFPENCIASMVAMTREGHEAEIAIVGREGMTDMAIFLGSKTSPLRCFIQIPGYGLRVPSSAIVDAYRQSEAVRVKFNFFAYNMMYQIAHTALANAAFPVERRLARWILLCNDRLDGDEVAMTHEFLSVMLNVRRAGVTLALRSLQNKGFLQTGRGSIQIIDRKGLEGFAGDAYSIESNFSIHANNTT